MITRSFNSALEVTGNQRLERPIPVATEVKWDPADPLVVEFVFSGTDSPDGETVWEVARELVQAALHTSVAVGKGDVKMRRHGPFMILCLTTEDMHADLKLPYAELQELIDESTSHTPLGLEDVSCMVDDAIERILSS